VKKKTRKQEKEKGKQKKAGKEMIKHPNLGTWEGHQCEIKVFP
jgi:hypothetical protein